MSAETISRGSRLIEIYTDGSFDAKARFGGWGFVSYEGGREVHSDSGGHPGKTNNRFEILAVMHASVWATSNFPHAPLLIWTDSLYVMQGFHRWLPIWRNNGWRKIDPNNSHRRRPSPDADVWQRLDGLIARGCGIRIEWCKAHSGDVANEQVDILANASRMSQWQMARQPYTNRH
ncbi:ribonuclease H family protein [Pararhizobium gei]|uniref:ribonuclease H family protein n=1 Tax=Pararhizobium gei TaxID=1395951 RepID=UPI0023DC7AAF|nr:ribonuclease H [Rhizobium gei]